MGSTGSLYLAFLALLRSALLCYRLYRSNPALLQAPLGAPGAEPPLSKKLQSLVVHALALLISFAELSLNDLPAIKACKPLYI